ncbi:phenylalanine ammonia-lyase [Russula earlei]|uniref:Phenylalanine ammonia-lyase n=1 Tax=Russula earlei TaxID=71964 RepID=A0ACC0UA73_9AGAM|nr:phenylalanine ammonia-lyase [Russula earlei]
MTVTASAPETFTSTRVYKTRPASSDLLSRFIAQYEELQSYKNGKPIVLDGQSLTVAGVIGVARHGASVALNDAPEIRKHMAESRKVLMGMVQSSKSVYGVSTGLGGSADTRTNDAIGLGLALLQHHNTGVLPSVSSFWGPLPALPLSDPLATTTMPEAWVRGAILVRINSLIRGHSAVRWELLEKMSTLLHENITPCVPLRGSISASGDLTPLAYIAGTISGLNNIRVFDGPRVVGAREIVSCSRALQKHHIEPLPLLEKETLGIMNGTAFSTSVAALALHEAMHLALLAQVCTAMGTESLLGVRANYDPLFMRLRDLTRGRCVEAARTIWELLEGSQLAGGHEKDVSIDEDQGELRQDRYTLRTAPQFLGPQIEDIISALNAITIECNSTTDNPIFNGATGEVHHGGNFQAMAVTNAMEKTRLALHHIGKLLFAQATELMNPTMNRGLPPSLAASNPSLDYHGKGLDIAIAAYISEMGFLANPVSTHIQSAEMHNQAVKFSLDIRAMQAEFEEKFREIVQEELLANFGSYLSPMETGPLLGRILCVMLATLDATTTMDTADRMVKVTASGDSLIVQHFTEPKGPGVIALSGLRNFNGGVAKRATALFIATREAFLTGARGPAPAKGQLKGTRAVYEYVRTTLKIKMHGLENHRSFPEGLYVEEVTIGEKVSLIYEAIRDGEMQGMVVRLFR